MQEMKKILAVVSLVIGYNCFSFYKLEGIYVDSAYNKETSEIFKLDDWYKAVKVSKSIFVHPNRPIYCSLSLFLYDKNTNIQLAVKNTIHFTKQGKVVDFNLLAKNLGFSVSIDENFIDSLNKEYPRPILKNVNFLNGNFTYDSIFNKNIRIVNGIQFQDAELNEINLKCIKQKLIFNEEGSIRKDKNNFFADIYRFSNSFHSIEEQLISCTNVSITNQDQKVILEQGGKKVDLDEALKHYFVSFFNQDRFIESLSKLSHIASDVKNSEKTLKYRESFNLDGRKSLDPVDFDRLQNSTILAVWCLIPEDKKVIDSEGKEITKKIEGQMVGLARDERTKELYHWAIDLGQDVSILMNYTDSSQSIDSYKVVEGPDAK